MVSFALQIRKIVKIVDSNILNSLLSIADSFGLLHEGIIKEILSPVKYINLISSELSSDDFVKERE